MKYWNDQYCQAYRYFIENDVPVPQELFGPIFELTDPPEEQNIEEDEDSEEDDHSVPYVGPYYSIKKFDFEDPLYPYEQMNNRQSFGNKCKIGLFRITGLRKSIFKGVEGPFRKNDPYNFVWVNETAVINTRNIIYGETLMWVDLDRCEIRPALNKEKLLKEKAVATYGLPSDLHKEISKNLGGTKRRTKRRKTSNMRKKHKKTKTRKY